MRAFRERYSRPLVPPPLQGLSGSADRSIQRVQKVMRRSVDMIDRSELFLELA